MATIAPYVSNIRIQINGVALSKARMDRLEEVAVEQSVHLPDMFVLNFADINSLHSSGTDNAFELFDGNVFPIGAEVQVDMGTPAATIMKGEITGLEVEVGEDGAPAVAVRGYARSHRLHRGRQTRSFTKMRDSDIVSKIATEVGLTADTEATKQQHDYIYQNNQTNWEFLRERAARVGYELFVDGRTLHFRKPQRGMEVGPKLILGASLSSFQVRVSTLQQAAEVEVRGWDPTNKAALVGKASTGAMAPQLGWGTTGQKLAASFGAAKVYVVNHPVATQDEANTLAKAVFDSLDGAFIQAEGVCDGNPEIRPGKTVEIAKVGMKLSGKYYVTSATHRYRMPEGYETSFAVSGRQSDSMLELLATRREAGSLPAVVVGVVTDNADKDGNLGRVKVKFPWLSPEESSAWARIASPMAGKERGFYFLPEVNDEVLIAFEQGDITRPYVIGGLWNGVDKPPKANSAVVANSVVNERLIKSRSGHLISLDDTDKSEKIEIKDKTGKNLIKVESASNKITIQAEGDITIISKGKIEITSTQDTNIDVKGNAKIKANQNVEVAAQGSAKVSAGTNASVAAQTALELKGASVNIEATGSMNVKANGPLVLKGAVVNIN